VGCQDLQVFNSGALKFIWRHCEGIPRRINNLCDNALLIGYALQRKIIDEKIVAEAAGDYQENIHKKVEPLNDGGINPILGIPLGKRIHRSTTAGFAIAGIAAVFFLQWIGEGMWERENQREADAVVLPTSVNREVDESKRLLTKSLLEPQSSLPRELDKKLASYPAGISSDTDAQPSFPSNSVINSQITPQTDAGQGQKEAPVAERILKRAEEKPKDAAKLVIVGKTDTLEKIIQRQYGTVNLKLFIAVLQANPEIENPDKIWVGQDIRLPLNINNLIVESSPS
jgi:general secretion pathway protein A